MMKPITLPRSIQINLPTAIQIKFPTVVQAQFIEKITSGRAVDIQATAPHVVASLCESLDRPGSMILASQKNYVENPSLQTAKVLLNNLYPVVYERVDVYLEMVWMRIEAAEKNKVDIEWTQQELGALIAWGNTDSTLSIETGPNRKYALSDILAIPVDNNIKLRTPHWGPKAYQFIQAGADAYVVYETLETDAQGRDLKGHHYFKDVEIKDRDL